jgi:pyruvate kinase
MEKYTKIIATIGPASESEQIIKKLYHAGMNVARLNFSHGNHEYFKKIIQRIKKVSDKIAILLDTKGPEIRSGDIENEEIVLNGEDEIIITNEKIIGTNKKITINYDKLMQLKVGNKLLIDDGLIAAIVVKKLENELIIKILNGGILGSRKTICVQGHNVKIPFMSSQDKLDIQFGINNNVDFIAASFVRCKDDVIELKKLLLKNKSNAKIISKIEHWNAVENFDEILNESDGIMVARGDLGIEISMEKVPRIQREIISKCNNVGKPVIVATQMLESMKSNPRPTRAEVNDVAQAILQGTDAIMLSGETASGKYAVESVQMMTTISKEYDSQVKSNINQTLKSPDLINNFEIAKFVTQSAYHASNTLKTSAIMTPTTSGFTARMVSRFKPKCKIIAMTEKKIIYRQLALSWGVIPIHSKKVYKHPDDLIKAFVKKSYDQKYIKKSDMVVITAGFKMKCGHTNLLEIYPVNEILN